MIGRQASKLALGGAQFGMRYGIANRDGQPSCAAVNLIVRRARECGISLVDTAYAYGSSESVLGSVLIESGGDIRIVTKTQPTHNDVIAQRDIESLKVAFQASLTRLNRSHVYSLLVHHAGDLLKRGGDLLWAWMQSTKADGKAEKIGVSVYSPEQLNELLDRYQDIELVQLPLNIYDQRFARSGLLQRLKQKNIEVHARSAFLQGLLLMAPELLPDQFDAIRSHQAALHEWLRERGLSPLAGALSVCIGNPQVDLVVVGCDSVQQLDDIIVAASGACPSGCDQFAIGDERIIDPSLWTSQN